MSEGEDSLCLLVERKRNGETRVEGEGDKKTKRRVVDGERERRRMRGKSRGNEGGRD